MAWRYPNIDGLWRYLEMIQTELLSPCRSKSSSPAMPLMRFSVSHQPSSPVRVHRPNRTRCPSNTVAIHSGQRPRRATDQKGRSTRIDATLPSRGRRSRRPTERSASDPTRTRRACKKPTARFRSTVGTAARRANSIAPAERRRVAVRASHQELIDQRRCLVGACRRCAG